MKPIATQELFPPDDAALISRLAAQTHPELARAAGVKLEELKGKYEAESQTENRISHVRNFSMRAREAVYGGAFIGTGIYADKPAAVFIGAAVIGVNEAFLYRQNKPARKAKARVQRIKEYLLPFAVDNAEVTLTNVEGETA